MSWDNLAEEITSEVFHNTPLWERLQFGLSKRVAYIAARRSFLGQCRLGTKRPPSMPCRGCQKVFDNRSTGWLRMFCSASCRVSHFCRAATARRRKALGQIQFLVCAHCSVPFSRPRVGGKPRKYCGTVCANKVKILTRPSRAKVQR